MSAMCSPFMDRFAAVIIVTLVISTSAGAVEAGVGDSQGTVGIPAGAQCGGVSGTAVTMVPGGKAGFPKIPVLLVTSCLAKLFFLDMSTDPATIVKTITTTVTPANGWGALAIRADKGDLLACTVVAGGTDVYSIDFSPFNAVPDGTATKLRSAPAGPAGSVSSTCAGIAWDPQSKTIYQSSTGPAILHYPETGTGALTPIPSGCTGATAGVGIAGTSLFAGCQPASSSASVVPEQKNGRGMTQQAAPGVRRTTRGS